MPDVMTGYTGIAFPMRIGPTGKIETSTTSIYDITHIIESIQQILGTRSGSRVFPGERYSIRDFGSNAYSVLFSPMNTPGLQVIKSVIAIALSKWEKRVRLQRAEIMGLDEHLGKVTVEIDILVIRTQKLVTTQITIG